jgi:hypothetical protein
MTCGCPYFLVHFVPAVVIFLAFVVVASHRSSAESRNRMYLWTYSSTQAATQIPAEGTILSNLVRFTFLPTSVPSKYYSIFAVPIKSRRSLLSSSESQVGPCRKVIRIFFFSRGPVTPQPCYISNSLRSGPRSRSFGSYTSLVSFARLFCTGLIPKDVSRSRRVRLTAETNIIVCAVLAASLQCIVWHSEWLMVFPSNCADRI